MNKFLDFTGSEKSVVALGPVVLPLTVLVQALLSWAGSGEMPDPVQVRDAIVYFLMTIITARLVWQVPNSDVVKADTVEVKIPETKIEKPTATKTKSKSSTTLTKPKVEKESIKLVVEENPVV